MIYCYFFSRKDNESKLDFDKIKSTLKRYKNPSYPRVPKTFEEIAVSMNQQSIQQKYGNSLKEDKKFYVDTVISKNHSFTVFACFRVIEMIKQHIDPKQRFYLLDGTFDIATKPFYQLLIVSIEYKNDVSR